jgi:hypothetical protein
MCLLSLSDTNGFSWTSLPAILVPLSSVLRSRFHAHVVVAPYVLHFHFVRVPRQPIKVFPQISLPNVRLYVYTVRDVSRSILYRPVFLISFFLLVCRLGGGVEIVC